MNRLKNSIIILAAILTCGAVAHYSTSQSSHTSKSPKDQIEEEVIVHGGHGGHHGGHHHGHHGHHHEGRHRRHAHHQDHNWGGNNWNQHGYWHGGGGWGNHPGYYYDPNYYYNAAATPSYSYVAPIAVPEQVQPTAAPGSGVNVNP